MTVKYVLYRTNDEGEHWFYDGTFSNPVSLAERSHQLGTLGYKIKIETEGEIC